MRKMTLAAAGVLSAALLSGCATSYPVGGIITQLKLPVTVGDGVVPKAGLKKGVSECKSYLAMVAIGDASIETAARNGGITKIHFVDWDVENVLGIIGTYRCTVWGE